MRWLVVCLLAAGFAGATEAPFAPCTDDTPECKQQLERIARAKSEASERGGGALTSFGGQNALGPPIPMVSYSVLTMPPERGPTLQVENRFDLSFPVFQSAKDTLAVSLAAGQLHLGEKPVMNSGQHVAGDFERYEFGTQYSHRTDDHDIWGIRASIGYAGDTPSSIPRDESYSLTGTYAFPASGDDYWVVMVFIANNSALANYIPIPGVMYIHKTEHFMGMFGFPVLSMQWTPVDPWAYSLSIFGITAQAEVSYGHFNALQYFVGYAYTRQSFIPSVRVEDRDRVVFHEEKIGPGLRIPVGARMHVEAQVGWSFDHTIAIQSGLSTADGGSLRLQNSWFGALSLKYLF